MTLQGSAEDLMTLAGALDERASGSLVALARSISATPQHW